MIDPVITCACHYQLVRNGVVLARPLLLDGRGKCPRCGRWLQLPVTIAVTPAVTESLEGVVMHRGRGRPRKY